MTTQTQPRILSLSAELARTDDVARHQSAERWNATVHRLCLLRATANETAYETEWARILEHRLLFEDMKQPGQLCLAAIDVLDIQYEHSLMVCRADGIPFDEDTFEEARELLGALRLKDENSVP